MFSPRSAMYHLGDDNSMLHGSKGLLIELKACEKALAGYAFGNVGGFLAPDMQPLTLCGPSSTARSRKRFGMSYCQHVVYKADSFGYAEGLHEESGDASEMGA